MSDGSGPFNIGGLVTVEAVFTRRLDGVAMQPDLVKARLLKPDGTSVTLAVSSETPPPPQTTINRYFVRIEPDEPGDWVVRFEGIGAAEAAEEIVFSVRRRRVPVAP